MFNFEQAIQNWSHALKKSRVFEDHHILELETLIRDEINELLDLGYTAEDAFKLTIVRFNSVKNWALEHSGFRTENG